MKALQKTLFVIALLFISVQMFRHVYIKYIESDSSVLDQYRDEVENKIYASKELEELIGSYEKAHKELRAYESDPKNKPLDDSDRYDTRKEPYRTEQLLRKEIEKRESHKAQVHQLRFFWGWGLVSIVIGFIVYLTIDQWMGICGLITGFTEMIYWTSPTIFGSRGSEFEQLLNNKLGFSVATWLLLILSWVLIRQFQGKERLFLKWK